ncbi:MAG: methionine synthase [Selenomonadaceae bacterium]|nr:methionine synthase [Selenomonadaceae bacterium]
MPMFGGPLTSLNEKEVRRYARAEKIAKEIVDRAIADAIVFAVPTGFYQIFDYDDKNGIIMFENNEVALKGKDIRKHLGACEKAAVLAVTVGDIIEEEISDASKRGDYAYSLILDAAATEAVEETANNLEKVINLNAKKEGYYLTSRFSPGYGDFPIEAQRDILTLSGGGKIGIDLTESLMLTPRKSVTAIIGFTRNCRSTNKKDCKNCNKKDCLYKK